MTEEEGERGEGKWRGGDRRLEGQGGEEAI